MKLLRLQRHLQEDLDKPYLDLSLHDTVSNLILDGQHKRAEQLYREFKIPDKRWGSWGQPQGWSPAVGLGLTGVPQVLVAEDQRLGHPRRLGGDGEVLQEQEVAHRVLGEGFSCLPAP